MQIDIQTENTDKQIQINNPFDEKKIDDCTYNILLPNIAKLKIKFNLICMENFSIVLLEYSNVFIDYL